MTGGNFDRDDFDGQDRAETLDEPNILRSRRKAGEARSFGKRLAAGARRGKDAASGYQTDEVSDADLRDLGYLHIESDAKGG